jgi:hypothetical protein
MPFRRRTATDDLEDALAAAGMAKRRLERVVQQAAMLTQEAVRAQAEIEQWQALVQRMSKYRWGRWPEVEEYDDL